MPVWYLYASRILGTENVAMNKTVKVIPAIWHLYPNGRGSCSGKSPGKMLGGKLDGCEVIQARDQCHEPRQSSVGGEIWLDS